MMWIVLSSPISSLPFYLVFFLKIFPHNLLPRKVKIYLRNPFTSHNHPTNLLSPSLTFSLFNNHYFVKHILKYWWMSLCYFFGQHINWGLIFGRDCFKNSSITVPNRYSLFTDLLPRSTFKKINVWLWKFWYCNTLSFHRE